MSDKKVIKADALAEVLAEFENNMAELAELDVKGSVLFVEESGMALNFAENGQPYQCGLRHARVFSEAECALRLAPALRVRYENGNGKPALLVDFAVAKQKVMEMQANAIAILKGKYEAA